MRKSLYGPPPYRTGASCERRPAPCPFFRSILADLAAGQLRPLCWTQGRLLTSIVATMFTLSHFVHTFPGYVQGVQEVTTPQPSRI